MIRSLDRRLGSIERAQPATLPLSLRRWLGEPLTNEQHQVAETEVKAASGFVGPPDYRRMDTDMLDWLSMRGDHHAS